VLRPALIAEADEVLELAGAPDGRVFDARAPERFRGQHEPIDPVAGHIPGALCFPFTDNLQAGQMKSVAELTERYRAALAGAPPERAVAYCGSGVTACQLLLAAEHAGLPGIRLYPGSWSEWICDPRRPVSR
jgi:thiosulfate/3-mercaptopyruvate sulfurtransferase